MNDNNDRYRKEHMERPTLPQPTPSVSRKIYIALTHDNEIIGIILAESPEVVNAYFVGRGEIPNHIGVIDPNDNSLGVQGLCIIMKTHLVQKYSLSDRISEIRFQEKS